MSSTRRNSTERLEQDAYQTPGWCIEKLKDRITWDGITSFYEPCRGDGNIYNAIPLPDQFKGWAEIKEGRDYLTMQPPIVDLIITNPPYSDADAFIRKALTHGRCVIMLLRLNYLETQARYGFWLKNPPTHLITLSKRPSFIKGGTDSTGYGWFVWDMMGVVTGGKFQWIK